MKAFIDDFSLVRIESNQAIGSVTVRDMPLELIRRDGTHMYYQSPKPLLLHVDDSLWIDGTQVTLEIGTVTLKPAFDQIFRYDGPLGAQYHKDQTVFTVFSPVAKEVILVLDGMERSMRFESPVWTVTAEGDFEGKPYHYRVRLTKAYHDVKDPYTTATGFKDQSYVIDWSKTNPVRPLSKKLRAYTDAVIYEGHVRDLTINLDVPSKGLFEGLIEHSNTLSGSVLDYVKRLGMTHLQLLPVFDFDGVFDRDKSKAYNWGYNPAQYFVLEGWYARDPDDPYGRVNAFKQVLDAAHGIGLGINMDVVYNHVNNRDTFPYDYLVPGYFFRHDAKSKPTEASFCGNDVETRHYMVRRLIIDSLVHFVTHYQVDGFRFDLMGLMDLETMRQIEKTLKAINPNIMLYGEGWNMITEVPTKEQSNMANQARFKGIAHFNDQFRNTMKGALHGPEMGYAMGNKALAVKVPELLLGSPHLFLAPTQSINYVECHDNLTFYDKMLLAYGFEKDDFKHKADVANQLIAISQGIPFYHAGQEFYRSKKGVENSYKSPDEINMIHWRPRLESIRKLKKLLKIRRTYKLYRMASYGDHAAVYKIGECLVYRLEDASRVLIHYIKATKGLEKIDTHGAKLIFNTCDVLMQEDSMVVDEQGIYILRIDKNSK
ncbi:MAG: type I pullulanase [Acholeplasmataceae bacterium]|nr:type I pullulanase [Acholeplasmataceae bacterium]